MRVYSLSAASSKVTAQKLNNGLNMTVSNPINKALKSGTNNVAFCGTKKLVIPNVESEESKRFLSKMRFLDKVISDKSKMFEPILIFRRELSIPINYNESELINVDHLLSLDKTKDDRDIYTFTEHYKTSNREYTIDKMKCIFDKKGQMIQGSINDSKYVLSFERNNKNMRRLTFGDRDGTTVYAPAKDSSQIWTPIASQSDYIQRLSSGINNVITKSAYRELFMELTKLDTSIKTE